jgi:5-methylcytosine-specific restriction enzyme A
MKIEVEDIRTLPKYLITSDDCIQISGKRYSSRNEPTNISDAKVPDSFLEGGIRQITIELRFRSKDLRIEAIKANNGYKCCICDFDFEETYGDLGAGYIEIHHLIPIGDSDKERLTTVDQVAVVCANCHSVLHHHGKIPIKVDVIKEVVERRRSRSILPS